MIEPDIQYKYANQDYGRRNSVAIFSVYEGAPIRCGMSMPVSQFRKKYVEARLYVRLCEWMDSLEKWKARYPRLPRWLRKFLYQMVYPYKYVGR